MVPENFRDIDHYEEIELLGRNMLFTDYRVKRDSLPEGLHAYSIRHSDEDWGEPATIEESVVVNYFGCVITDKPIDLGDQKYLIIDKDDFWFTDGHDDVKPEDIEAYFKDLQNDGSFACRKKPVEVRAIEWTGENLDKVNQFMNSGKLKDRDCSISDDNKLAIETLEGTMVANIGDFIIRGVNGEYYPCKPDIFEKTYDRV